MARRPALCSPAPIASRTNPDVLNLASGEIGGETLAPGLYRTILSKTGITLQTNASLHGRAFAQSLVAIDDDEITAP